MPIEGIFFFGLLMGFTNLIEIYKQLGRGSKDQSVQWTLWSDLKRRNQEYNSDRSLDLLLGVYESACDLNDVLIPNDNTTDQGFPDENEIINCNERDFYFSTASTLGVVSMSIFTFPLGIILDNYGCFISR